jgi:hypothetical protein
VVTRSQLKEYIDPDVLPRSFGGNLEFGPREYLLHLEERVEKFGEDFDQYARPSQTLEEID